MIKINKSNPPASFLTFSSDKLNTFDNLPSAEKVNLRTSLANEQKNICSYCERVLGKFRFIEHHCEQSICNGEDGEPDRTLDYTNLLLVCDGSQYSVLELTCDKKKAEGSARKYLPMKFNPLINAHCATIKYHNTGKISSSNTDFDIELNEVLNLNAPHLKDLRKRKWKRILSVVHKPTGLDKKKLDKIVNTELNVPHFELDFPGLSKYILCLFI